MSVAFGKEISKTFLEGRKSLAAFVVLLVLAWGLLHYPVTTGLVLLGAAILTLGLIRPRFLLYIGFFFYFTDLFTIYHFLHYPGAGWDIRITIAPATFFYILALFFWGAARLARLTPPAVHANTLDLPLLVYGLVGWIALLWSAYPYPGLGQQIFCAQGLIFYFVITRLIQTPRQVEFLAKFWFFAGIFLAAVFVTSIFIERYHPYGVYFSITDHFFIRAPALDQYIGTRDTISGLASHPKYVPSMIGFAIPLSMALFCTQRRRLIRILILISIIPMLIEVILAYSRTELAGMLGGWVVFSYLMPGWRPKFFRKQVLMVGFFGIAFVLAALFLANFYPLGYETEFQAKYFMGSQYQTRGGESSGSTGSTDVRIDRAIMVIEAMWKTGGFGGGTGGILSGTGRPDPGNQLFEFIISHGYGLLSLIFVAWFVANMVMEMRQSIRKCRDERYMVFLAAACWILMANALICFLDIPQWWVALGMGMAAAQAVYQTGEGQGLGQGISALE